MSDCRLFEELVLPAVPRARSEVSAWRFATHVARCPTCRDRAERLCTGLAHLDLPRDVDSLGPLAPSVSLGPAHAEQDRNSRLPAEAGRSWLGSVVNGHALPIAGIVLALVITLVTVSWVGSSVSIPRTELEALIRSSPRPTSEAYLVPVLGPVVLLVLLVPGFLSRIACGREGCFV